MKQKLARSLNSLTAKYVAVFVLLVAVPAVAVAVYTLSSAYDREKADIEKLQEDKANALAASFDESLNGVFTQLGSIHGAGL